MSYAALDIFQQLRQEDIHWMLASAELRTISANGVLVREDDPSETIFFIADGLFEVYVYGGATNKVKVGQLGPGEAIGEISWLDGRPISASVRALETSSVIALSIALLEQKLAEDPGFAARLFRAIATLAAERLRKTTSFVRRAELAAAQRPAAGASADGSGVLRQIGELKKLVAEADRSAAGKDGAISDDHAAQDPPGVRRPGAEHRCTGSRGCGKARRCPAGRAAAARAAHGHRRAVLLQAPRLCRRLPDHRDDLRQRPGRHRRHRAGSRRLHAEPCGGEGRPQPAPPDGVGDPGVLRGGAEGIPRGEPGLRAGG